MIRAYKYRGGIGNYDKDGKSIFERDVNAIVNNQIYLPIKNELNDPTEGFFNDDKVFLELDKFKDYSQDVRRQYLELKEKFNKVGVYSLSKNNDNELLWSYYAGGHSGFAVEYDIDILKDSINHNKYFELLFSFNVEYKRKIPKVSISDIRSIDIVLSKYLGTKSLSWKHEKEYRLVFEDTGLLDVDYRAVTGIYFGYKMKDSEIDFIMNQLKGRGLDYYKIELIDKTYKFRSIKVEDRYKDAPKYMFNCLEYDIDKLHITKKYLGEKAYSYKNKLIEALEIVKCDPLIKEIYMATVNLDLGEPLFIIFAYTKSERTPVKEYNFKLNEHGEIYKSK